MRKRREDTRTDEEKAADKARAQRGFELFQAKQHSELEFTGVKPHAAFGLNWGCWGVGFGQFYFHEKDGKLIIDNENMSKEFIKAALCAMVDAADLEFPRG